MLDSYRRRFDVEEAEVRRLRREVEARLEDAAHMTDRLGVREKRVGEAEARASALEQQLTARGLELSAALAVC